LSGTDSGFEKFHPRGGLLSSDCRIIFSGELSKTKCRKILFAPQQARYGPYDIVFKGSDGGQISNDLLVQLFEASQILAGQNSRRGVGPMLEGGMKFFDLD
jgi:hypothetical protein